VPPNRPMAVAELNSGAATAPRRRYALRQLIRTNWRSAGADGSRRCELLLQQHPANVAEYGIQIGDESRTFGTVDDAVIIG